MASGPEGTELLKCQTTILKVSIHCEGCKKKVKKVLHGLEGVYAIDINSKQNKVTVTGSVDAESLIRRLLKYGKHAELWPEKKPTASNSSSEASLDSNTKIATITTPTPKTEQNLPNTEKEHETEESKNKTISTSPTEATATANSDEVSPSKINIDAPNDNDSDKPANSDKKDSEKPATAEQANNASEKADDLKKGEKAQEETSSIAERAISNSDMPKEFPVYAQPVYTVNYSAVQPSTSYAYYTPSEVVMPSSYTYSGNQFPTDHPSENYMYYGSMEAQAASGGSYDMFNEENPNACNLM